MSSRPPVKCPEDQALAKAAYAASGCRTAEEFADFLGGVAVRTVWRWLRGEGPLGALPTLVLREIVAGWRPSAKQ